MKIKIKIKMKNMTVLIFSLISIGGISEESETNLKNLYIQEIETELELESWMLDEYIWNGIEIPKDDTLKLESWMFDEKFCKN
jgi:hypothetical protein